MEEDCARGKSIPKRASDRSFLSAYGSRIRSEAASQFHGLSPSKTFSIKSSKPKPASAPVSPPFNTSPTIPFSLVKPRLPKVGQRRKILKKENSNLSDGDEELQLQPRKLLVRVICGSDLSFGDEIGNPYVKICGTDMKWKKTKVVKKGINPEWKELFEIQVRKTLKIQVWDKDVLRDEFLGKLSLKVQGNSPIDIKKTVSLERC
eukprot:TRINITY_DN10516_c0_g1_i1.p1 TRINITY_DN10516_c0_g1~~TRINITY_DN10516_c0_g1_i1.p1  ORF type:complete len:205 (+),score=34.15 TRINITY_DN10516_c0_g1_i1:188-802(+)